MDCCRSLHVHRFMHNIQYESCATVRTLHFAAAAAREDMLGLAERLGKVLQGLPEELRTARWRQLHFATSPLPALQGSSWLPRLLGSWCSPRRVLRVQTSEGTALLRTSLCSRPGMSLHGVNAHRAPRHSNNWQVHSRICIGTKQCADP